MPFGFVQPALFVKDETKRCQCFFLPRVNRPAKISLRFGWTPGVAQHDSEDCQSSAVILLCCPSQVYLCC